MKFRGGKHVVADGHPAPFRASVCSADHQVSHELIAVRGLDGFGDCPEGLAMWHLFGPAGVELPEGFHLCINPTPEHAYLKVEVEVDPYGRPRFTRPRAVLQTPN